MKALRKKKNYLIACLILMTNFSFAQPGPPPGPPTPLVITNNTPDVISLQAVEKESCYAMTYQSTQYVIQPGSTVLIYTVIPNNAWNTRYWMGVSVYWYVAGPPSLMSSKGNPFTFCQILPTIVPTGLPNIDWSSPNVINIY